MSKELILKTLRHEETERVPWVPFSGIHSGKLKGYTAEEVLKDSNKLYESLIEVFHTYGPDGMPIMFDLQLEAEVLGCDLLWARDNPPSVSSHPYEGKNKGIPCSCKIPTKNDGRIPLMLDAMKKVKAEIGDEVALYGLVTGPLTLASHLRGSELFLDMIKDKEYVKELVEFCAQVAMAMVDYYLEAGMDIIAIVDPLVSQVAPKAFEKMLSESFTAVFDYIRSKGAYSFFFVCGNATPQIDVMCKTNPDGVAVDENVDLVKAKVITDKYNLVLSGNIPLTSVMLFGTPQDNMKFVVNEIDTVNAKKNFIVSPGCDMPYDVPVENTIACGNAVRTTDTIRPMIEGYEGSSLDDIVVELPDYEHLDKPLIECFTIDSEQCAACTYMVDAAKQAKARFGDKIHDIVEYKYTKRENVKRDQMMGIKNLPAMAINGVVKYVSIIPSSEELDKEIEKLL